MTLEPALSQKPRSGSLDSDGDTASIPAPIAPGHSATPRSGLCGRAIDWAALARLRPATIINEGVPPYLLLTEIRALIEQAPEGETTVSGLPPHAAPQLREFIGQQGPRYALDS